MLASSHSRPRTRLLVALLAVSLPLGATPAPVHAAISAGPTLLALLAEAKVTPEQAANDRRVVQARAQSLRKAGDHGLAAEMLSEEAGKRSDPVLYLDAADAYQAAGAEARSRPDLELGIEKARVGLDILYFLQDPRCDPDWQVVDSSKISGEISRGERIIAASEQSLRDLDKKVEVTPEPDAAKKRAPRDGRGLIAAGSLLTVVGVGGLAMIGAGTALSVAAQKDVDEVDLSDADFQQQIDDIDARGKTANKVAYAGIAVGAVGLAAGIALLVVGVKKRKKYRAEHGGGDETTARVQLLPTAGRGQAGLVLLGRF